MLTFENHDWSDFCFGTKEAIPPYAPETHGKPKMISCFVDSDHAGNLITRCSHLGKLIFCNRAPILWYSNCHNTVETFTFGIEFFATRSAVELIEAYNTN
jgi:hypothetical protein